MSRNCVSVEERVKVYELCKTQLGGKWTEVSESELIIKPVTDGIINKLYFCFLPENIRTKHNKVVVRYVDYESFKGFANRNHIIVINLFMNEFGISPKVLSIFHNGTITEYIQFRYLNPSDDLNTKVVELLAQKVAKIHSLDLPIPKDRVQEINDAIFVECFEKKLKQDYTEGVIIQEIERHKYPVLSKLDFVEEVKWLRKTIEDLNSPLVMSHNDLNRSNILLREHHAHSQELEIFLIDFDWSGYNYRGIDLGQYFACWRHKQFFAETYNEFPSDQQMTVFIDAYNKEMTKLVGSSYAEQDINSREQLIREAKIFALFAFVKFVLTSMMKTLTGDKETLAKGEKRLQCYDELKMKILRQYSDS